VLLGTISMYHVGLLYKGVGVIWCLLMAYHFGSLVERRGLLLILRLRTPLHYL
jgi:hypothetical protein